MDIVKSVMDDIQRKKILDLGNQKVNNVIEQYYTHLKPAKITVITDSEDDIEYIRRLSLEKGEELDLTMKGHTIHFDGELDQGRDKKNTCVLVEKGDEISPRLNTIDRSFGLDEICNELDGLMKGKEMLVRFFCLGPTDSKFSKLALQITDSSYVAHSEDLLYRKGYEQFKKLKGSDKFYYFVHSAGDLENAVTKSIVNRRIYIDLKENRVITANSQYAGNTLGLKKLALRLAINEAIKDCWLTEHMFISGVYSLNRDRKTYFMGAYPSSCGKTSTSMIPGNTIVGDDIAYIRIDDEGVAKAVNIENGIFGIIKDVNAIDDPIIYNVITSPREMIFSNVLINDGKPYWNGMGQEIPSDGINFQGEWNKGKLDSKNNEIPPSHGNARYTIRLEDLDNVDPELQNPDGVEVEGILYGGRDSDTSVPIAQSLSWEHGVSIGATIESETTAATLGAEGVRVHQMMAIADFVVVPIGNYLSCHFKFPSRLMNKEQIKIFSTNYFLKDENGQFFDDKVDKKIWLIWAEGRIHNEFDAILTPIGYIPIYEDLKKLFREVFDKEYTEDRYLKEFAVRTTKWLDKIERMKKSFSTEGNIPDELFEQLEKFKTRVVVAKEKFGEIIPPSAFI